MIAQNNRKIALKKSDSISYQMKSFIIFDILECRLKTIIIYVL